MSEEIFVPGKRNTITLIRLECQDCQYWWFEWTENDAPTLTVCPSCTGAGVAHEAYLAAMEPVR